MKLVSKFLFKIMRNYLNGYNEKVDKTFGQCVVLIGDNVEK